MKFWEFRMHSKTKFLTGTTVRIEEGKLEEKLKAMLPEWELYVSDSSPFKLVSVE